MNNLNGSEKQIAWATDIRKEFIEKTKADMRSADKNDVLDMKAMLKVADNITEAADWINARRNIKSCSSTEPTSGRPEGRSRPRRSRQKRRIPAGSRASVTCSRQKSPKRTVTAIPPRRTKSHASSTTSQTGTPSPSLRKTDRPICGSRPMTRIPAAMSEIITNRHGEGRWVRDSTTGDYIQISGTSQYRLPRTKNALKCQLAFRLRR